MCLAVITALALVLPGVSGQAVPSTTRDRAVVEPELHDALARSGTAPVIVAFRAGSPAERARIRDRLGDIAGFSQTSAWRTIDAVAGTVTRAGLERLAVGRDVAAIDLDGGGRGGDAESLALIRATTAHQAGVVGSGVTVAVLDSGLDRAHPDLAGAIAGEHCFVPPSGCPNGAPEQDGPGSAQDDHGHGTNVAGIVTANGSVAPMGVAPAARIVAVKVLDAQNRFAGAAQVLSGLDWIAATRTDVRVVNLSLGTDQLFAGVCDDANATTRAFASVVAALRARGVTVVASAMNNGSPFAMAVPACIGGVVAVGAVYDSAFGPFATVACSDAATAPDRIACFSNGGSALDLLAPGARIASARLGGGISEFSGTSQAAPHVSGAVALLLQASPVLAPDGVESVLEASGVPVRDERNGMVTPRIDVAAALERLGTVSPPSRPVPILRLSPRRLGFGRVRVGSARRLSIRVGNAGTGTLVLSRVTTRAPFAVTVVTPVTVVPGSARRLWVTFRPRRPGRFRGMLTLSSNDPTLPTTRVPLTGTGMRS